MVGQDGKEVRLRTDNTTQKSGMISQEDRIEANVNEHNLALSIRSSHGNEAGHGNDLTLPARPAQWDASTNPFQPEAAGAMRFSCRLLWSEKPLLCR